MSHKATTIVLLMLVWANETSAKEVFKVEQIVRYLNKENPYVYTAIGKQYIDEARAKASLGAFDTKLSSYSDNKEYPLSDGRYSDVSLSKPTENGTELVLDYRNAQGVQEYNNIKTGSDGEYRVGVKVPVFALLNDINYRKYNVDTAHLQATQSKLEAQNSIRKLYSSVIVSYYTLLYYQKIDSLEKTLLSKAQKRFTFTQKRVASGDLPGVTLLEAKQQILQRKQRVLMAKNSYHNAFHILLKYLNISKDQFDARYTLPHLSVLKKHTIALQTAIDEALAKRSDLRALEFKKEKLNLQGKYNALSQYPDVSIAAYGVHDITYGNGMKVGINFDFPLERTGYEGRKVEIQRGMAQVNEEENKLMLELKTNLTNLFYSLEVYKQNLQSIQEEMRLVEELEKVENKKYQAGTSSLFEVNQREILTLQAQQKQLEYTLNVLLIQQDIKREMGDLIDP